MNGRRSLSAAVGPDQTASALLAILLMPSDRQAEVTAQAQELLAKKADHDKSRAAALEDIKALDKKDKALKSRVADLDKQKAVLNDRETILAQAEADHAVAAQKATDMLADSIEKANAEAEVQRRQITKDRAALEQAQGQLENAQLILANANKALDVRAVGIQTAVSTLAAERKAFEKEKTDHNAWHDANKDVIARARILIGAA